MAHGAAPPTLDRWLRRLMLLLAACVLVLVCVLLWRVAMVVYRVEQAVVRLSEDVQQVTSTGARLALQVERLADHVDELERRGEQALPIAETHRLLDELTALRLTLHEPAKERDEIDDAEIDHLLDAIRNSGHTFGYGRVTLPARAFHATMLAKYRTYRPTVDSAETFIDRVASETMIGQRYHVQPDEGDRRWLDDWLHDELARHREPPPDD